MAQENNKKTPCKEDSCSFTISYQGKSLEAEVISKGIAIAPVAYLQTKIINNHNTANFQKALKQVLQLLQEHYEADQNNSDREIFLAQQALLETLGKRVKTIEELEEAVSQEIQMLQGTTHASKADDYLDILAQVRTQMGQKRTLIFPEDPFILIASTLLPSDIPLLLQSSHAN